MCKKSRLGSVALASVLAMLLASLASAQDIWTFTSDLQSWIRSEPNSDASVAWDAGALVITYYDNAGSPTGPTGAIDFPGIRLPAGTISPTLNPLDYPSLMIDYE